jgi:hypothetical protein
LKGKNSNFTNNVYIGGGGGQGSVLYNKNKLNNYLQESIVQSENIINEVVTVQNFDTTENTDNSDKPICDNHDIPNP